MSEGHCDSTLDTDDAIDDADCSCDEGIKSLGDVQRSWICSGQAGDDLLGSGKHKER